MRLLGLGVCVGVIWLSFLTLLSFWGAPDSLMAFVILFGLVLGWSKWLDTDTKLRELELLEKIKRLKK